MNMQMHSQRLIQSSFCSLCFRATLRTMEGKMNRKTNDEIRFSFFAFKSRHSPALLVRLARSHLSNYQFFFSISSDP